jgi:simple sugar transport system substrate-binding protein
MPNPRRVRHVAAPLAAAGLLLAACSSSGSTPSAPPPPASSSAAADEPATGTKTYTIAMVTHQTPGDTFWDKIQAGARAAAKEHGVTLRYANSPQAERQATLIQDAVDSKVDGIATTLVTPDALAGAVKSAVAARIPVVALNAGIDQYKDLGATMFFGSNESLAGNTVGAKIAADGARHPLCIIQEAGSVALETRCAGVKAKAPGTENLRVNGADMASVTSSIAAKLKQDKSIDTVVTLGAPIAMAALDGVKNASSIAKVVTFDLNTDAINAIKDGKIQFAVDQQPYVQGYEAVDALWLNLTNGNDLGGGQPVLTGPSIVDKNNIDAIASYAARGTR